MTTGRLKNIQLSKALDKYYETVSRFKKGSQQEFYRINVIKRQPIASLDMSKITTVHIADYRDRRLSEKNTRTGKPISNNTVRLEMALLSNLFNIARIEWGTCRSNPVELVRKPKPSPGRERRLLKKEERLLSVYFREKNIELYCIFYFAIETSMRLGEILSAKWSDVSRRNDILFVPMTKNGQAKAIPLTRKARDIIKLMSPSKGDDGKIFTYTSNGFKSAWRTAVKKLNIDDLHFHDLRHEAISRFYELGTLTDLEISTISGHKSLAMLKRYAHIKSSYLAKKINSRKKRVKSPDLFMPYPAIVSETAFGEISFSFPDFEELNVIGKSVDDAMNKASVILLREIASRIHDGAVIPFPSDLEAKSRYTIVSPI